MKTIKQILSRIVPGVALGGFLMFSYSCTQDSAAADIGGAPELNAVYAKGKKARPIKAQLDFAFDFVNTPVADIETCAGGPPITLFNSLIQGNLSHLGILLPGQSFPEAENLPVSGSYLTPVSCNSGTFPTLESVYNGVYVAANGDELYTEESVAITFTNPPADFTVGTFEGTAEVIGGTGRFEGASGQWALIGGTFGDGIANWEVSGEITY
jgi:hypothetical protein